MRVALVALAAAGILLAPVSLTGPAAARDGALAQGRPVHEGHGARVMEWEGASALHLTGVCLASPRACVGSLETEDGRFFLPGTGSGGSVLVWWDAAHPSLRTLRASVGDRSAEGTSPLRLQVDGSAAGEYRVHVEPARDVVGRHDQPVQWRASFLVASAAPTLVLAGGSGYATTTGCVLTLCDDATVDHTSDPLLAPWTASGQLDATWDARMGALRVSIPGTSLAAEGAPPLSFPLDGLAPGAWRVHVDPIDVATPLESAEIAWSARLTQMG